MKYITKSSLDVDSAVVDTLKFSFVDKKVEAPSPKKNKKKNKARATKKHVKKEYLVLKSTAKKEFDLNKTLLLSVNRPIKTIDSSLIHVYELTDSAVIENKIQHLNKSHRINSR